jgi:hypothetical protein
MPRHLIAAAFAMANLAGPTSARAQTTADAPPQPVLTMSAAAGPMQFQGRSVALVSGGLEWRFHPHLAIAGDLGRWVDRDAPGFHESGGMLFESRQTTATIAETNLLFRAGRRRVSGFAGGGAGVHVLQSVFSRPVDSAGTPTGGSGLEATDVDLGLQALGGVDVHLTRRLTAFLSVRGEAAPDPNVGMQAGARVHLVTRAPVERRATPATRPVSAQASIGRRVDVIELDGARHSGNLLSLTDTEVAIERDGTVERIALSRVRLVRRPAHWARNLSLAGAGAFGAMAALTCCGEGSAYLTVYAAIAGGAGLGIGAMLNAASADERTLYRR